MQPFLRFLCSRNQSTGRQFTRILLPAWLCLLAVVIHPQLSQAQQQQTVTGKVVSSKDGAPLMGVSVQVKGTEAGTITDINGYFSLEVPEAMLPSAMFCLPLRAA